MHVPQLCFGFLLELLEGLIITNCKVVGVDLLSESV